MTRIAYIGPKWGTSLHRMKALRRLGHEVALFDPEDILPKSVWIKRWIHRTGGFILPSLIESKLRRAILRYAPEVLWVNVGELVGPGLLRSLRLAGVLSVNYNNDDPFRKDR